MPKTIRNVYDKELSFEKLLQAHKKARRGKREKKKVILFELILEQELLQLENDLRNCTYKHSKYTKFKVYQPKEREIMASEYRDRLVHQWYVQHFIKPYFVPQFINTTYACIEGRGMHKASKDVQKAMRSAKCKWKNYYILKMDIRKYFHNIDKRILWEILKRKMKDRKLLWLTREILLSTEGMVGLPLGNYTSQMFANIYLNELDQYVKHKLKCKYYYRYMDDMVILCENKETAKRINVKIYNLQHGHWKLVGKRCIRKSKINLTKYSNIEITNRYKIELSKGAIKKLKESKIQIIKGSEVVEHKLKSTKEPYIFEITI